MAIDQAANLRRIVKEKDLNLDKNSFKHAKILAVTSGKGGVGKTSLSVNLAALLAKSGKKILVIDADLGLSNVEIMLGVTPSYTLNDIITNKKKIEEVIIKGPFKIDFISGGNGFLELAELTDIEREEILIKIQKLDEIYDIIIIDTGAGISKNVTAFLEIADEILVITTSEPTSLTDAYSIIKILKENGNLEKVGLIINRVKSENEYIQASKVLINTTKRFLKVDIKDIGYIFEDVSVRKTIYKKTPFTIYYPDSKASTCVKNILSKITDTKIVGKEETLIDKFRKWFKSSSG
ncbi:flagellar biosynthesis protein FlhG [Hypnocyclicus thermotrophus]|uniref:Flagellar biosynthesis protein FlhG n=1 Tax=Hypnocyclicus thermotrophus TaxID=1627895 RepID=A0AA46DXP0_9FUSO|nr:MinD/ParA family protein [Hypnocyclicus thermotrophus]TDT68565.1 flagellar biosynthesis protein FlhG [Hypnocyclicus thermotrophus]